MVRRFLATSQHPMIRAARHAHRAGRRFSLPAPRVLVRPVLWAFLLLRQVYYTLKRLLICEPLFKAYCTSYGRGLKTGTFVHWVQGAGRFIVGHGVTVDGKSSFAFASRFSDAPTLVIGDNTGIGHACTFVIGKRIAIGRDCRIATEVILFDSSGHPSDPVARLAGLPPRDDEVRPIVIGDNVWIGRRSIIFPGVTIGEGSVVSAASVVMSDVPPYTLVAGNPARKIAMLGQASPAREELVQYGT